MGAEPSVAEWSNWSGKQTACPQAVVRPASEGAVVARVRSAAQAGSRVRCLGAGHSHSPLAATEGVLLDLEALAGVESVDREQRRARIRSGTRIFQLGSTLGDHGLALHNQGDIDRQALAGATATGTHGTGRSLPCLSASVVGARVALADGSLVDCDAEREPGLLALARLGLGAVGAITRLDLSVREAYRLRERMWLEPLDAVLDRIDALAAAHRHFEFFWYPGRAKAICKACDETDEAPEYPLADEGSRVGWSYEVLANHRPERHTEMEYSLPAGEGPACFREIRALAKSRFPEVAWPLEYRSVAADDVWLSMAHGRPTVTISVHQDVALDDAPYFRACEEIFARHAGRPHWGKVHYRSGKELAALYPRWDDWWRERDRYDPGGVFLNDHVASLRS